jgi:hypothetical protein
MVVMARKSSRTRRLVMPTTTPMAPAMAMAARRLTGPGSPALAIRAAV